MNILTFLEKNWKTVAIGFVAVVGVWGLGLLVTGQSVKKEQMAQERYFLTEKKYLELKTKKATPPTPPVATTDDKGKKSKKPVESAPVASAPVVDFTEVRAEFEKITTEFAGTKAAQMSALYAAEILRHENKVTEALQILQKSEGKDSGLINSLVQQQIAQILADQDKCSEAISVWEKIINRKEANFLQNELKIQEALCYQKMNDLKKAEEILTNLANQKSDNLEPSAASKEAERYLRLIQFKKVSGT